jgi:hypothetical protein
MSRDPDEWHLAINQTGWHLALTCQGAFKLRPWQVTPRDSARVYPGMIGAWRYFTQDGRLRDKFAGLPAWGDGNG